MYISSKPMNVIMIQESLSLRFFCNVRIHLQKTVGKLNLVCIFTQRLRNRLPENRTNILRNSLYLLLQNVVHYCHLYWYFKIRFPLVTLRCSRSEDQNIYSFIKSTHSIYYMNYGVNASSSLPLLQYVRKKCFSTFLSPIVQRTIWSEERRWGKIYVIVSYRSVVIRTIREGWDTTIHYS